MLRLGESATAKVQFMEKGQVSRYLLTGGVIYSRSVGLARQLQKASYMCNTSRLFWSRSISSKQGNGTTTAG